VKILIDTRVVVIYADLPETFKLRELLVKAKIKPNTKDEKVIYDTLVRMQKLGIIHKSIAKKGTTARKYTKQYSTLKGWFDEYITMIENQTQTNTTIEKKDAKLINNEPVGSAFRGVVVCRANSRNK